MSNPSKSQSQTGEYRRVELGEPANPPRIESQPQPQLVPAEEPQFKTGVMPIIPELMEDRVPREDNAPDPQPPQ